VNARGIVVCVGRSVVVAESVPAVQLQSRKRLKGKFDELQKTKMATKGGRKSFKQRMDKRAGAHKKWARK
jgi:uncharacterized membrane protein YcjF (UPF0283 family)